MSGLISAKVRQAIAGRLEDPIYGYNAAVTALAEDLGVTIPPMNFSGSAQFFQAYCDPELIEDGTTFAFPLILLYGIGIDNSKPTEKFRDFAGKVLMALDVVYSWDLDSVDPAAFEDTADIVEAAMIQVFNASDAPVWTPPCVLFAGQVKGVRSPVRMGGLGLLQQQSFTLPFTMFV